MRINAYVHAKTLFPANQIAEVIKKQVVFAALLFTQGHKNQILRRVAEQYLPEQPDGEKARCHHILAVHTRDDIVPTE